MKLVNKQAWAAVLSCDVAALDVALGQGANPQSLHPLGHSLIDQAARSPMKASSLCAILIGRGASVPAPGEPLALELVSRAIFEDSPILAKQLMSKGHKWASYLKDQKDLYFVEDPDNPSNLGTYLRAVSAFESIGYFNDSFSNGPAKKNTANTSRRGH